MAILSKFYSSSATNGFSCERCIFLLFFASFYPPFIMVLTPRTYCAEASHDWCWTLAPVVLWVRKYAISHKRNSNWWI